MIVRVSDDDYSMYYCTLCCRPFKPLQEANEHARFCGKAVPTQPVFRSYTTAATFEEDDDTQFYMNEARTWQGLTEADWEWVADKKETSLDTFAHGAAWAADILKGRNK